MRGIAVFSSCSVLVAACAGLSADPSTLRRPDCVGAGQDPSVIECDSGELRFRCGRAGDLVCDAPNMCVDSVCLPPRLSTCAAFPCNSEQTCVGDYCVSLGEACTDKDSSACRVGEACDVALGRCFDLPLCAADASCPVGERGAVCNFEVLGGVGRLEALGRVCLIGRCAADADCPAGQHCVDIGAEHEGLGVCR